MQAGEIAAFEGWKRGGLGTTARAMLILDEKELYEEEIERLTRFRRFEIAQSRRLKRIVEFSYPVDSAQHPLVQLSDLIVFLTRKFLELESGYKTSWSSEAKQFFASSYAKIQSRCPWSKLIDVGGKEEEKTFEILKSCVAIHRPQWRKHYAL